MASGAADRNAGQDRVARRADYLEQIPDEAWAQFVQMLRDKVREVQASEQTRAEFIQMLLEKVRTDPYPSRDQLDLIEASLPPEMVTDYARLLMEKASQEPFPSGEVLQRIQRMTDSRPLLVDRIRSGDSLSALHTGDGLEMEVGIIAVLRRQNETASSEPWSHTGLSIAVSAAA